MQSRRISDGPPCIFEVSVWSFTWSNICWSICCISFWHICQSTYLLRYLFDKSALRIVSGNVIVEKTILLLVQALWYTVEEIVLGPCTWSSHGYNVVKKQSYCLEADAMWSSLLWLLLVGSGTTMTSSESDDDSDDVPVIKSKSSFLRAPHFLSRYLSLST